MGSRLVGKEVSRDIIGRLKSLDLIAAGPRAPEPGAPYAYVTTRKFMEVFGLASLRELPDIEKLEDAGLLERPANVTDLDGVLGLREADSEIADETAKDWD
jgi:segregation and condensation protein B